MPVPSFKFLDPGPLRDQELVLEVVQHISADPAKGWVPAYEFEIQVDGRAVGRINFRTQNTPALEFVGGHIGYAVDERFRGHHYAERACRLLFPIARAYGHKELWISCDPK